MRIPCLLALAAGALLIGGCAAQPQRGAEAVNHLLAERGAPPVQWSEPATGSLPAEPLSLRAAVQLAFLRSPRLREQYAELGLASADLQDATHLPDLVFGYARLSGGGERQVTRSLSLAFTDLLLLRSRTRIANANFAITRDRVAAALLELESEVGAAWFEYVAARQSAELAATSTRAARASAEYARRLHAAGNLPPRALAQELAAASGAEIAGARAAARMHEARASFATLTGLSVRDAWQVPARLPAMPHHDELPANLAERAFAARPDLTAARLETEAFAGALRAARAWRWLGDFEVGYERETETGGARISGPTLQLSLPLFHWNRGGVWRAQALLDGARARRAALELGLRNDLSLGEDRLVTTRRIAESYRDALLPQAEAVSARTLEEVNFMLAGAFEALVARREQIAAGQEYLDAVRDYWLARVDLRRISGGALADVTTSDPLELESTPMPAPPDHAGHAGHGEGAHR